MVAGGDPSGGAGRAGDEVTDQVAAAGDTERPAGRATQSALGR